MRLSSTTFEHTIPTELRAGDSLAFVASDLSYPAGSGWEMTVYFVTATSRTSVVGVADGDGFTFALGAIASAAIAAGRVAWVAVVTKDDQRVTLFDSWIQVLPDLAGSGAATGLDTRSVAEQLLEAVEARLAGLASTAQLEKQVSTAQGSMALKYVPMGELLSIRDKLKAEVESERDAAAAADGLPSGRFARCRIVR